ncbi:nuclear transport factor 2 family protein [Pseudoalteromonas ardens]|uniref:Transcriptional regulator n=1 Tax=Pseudoalteromonas rubra TaxID=43658 RepID=A0A0L0ETT2_9GAMM|nr:nuclear transport factor 2 family protein [Pseudoalteromonas sp. R96]KNC67824.1 transcriptional regulator [Pseudoalteromonas rubra]MDK1310821.1 nuclear transport factor 2 family protein [Pseudoalteromonas sp. R96]
MTEQPDWLDNFVRIYNKLDRDTLHLLAEIYHPDIQFSDPLHGINGLTNLSTYFSDMYSNVISCQFDIHHSLSQGDQAALYWTMRYRHNRLGKGQEICVEGHSYLKVQDGKVIMHRDYFDAGSLLYEHIPLMGMGIRWLKARVSGEQSGGVANKGAQACPKF